MTTRAKRTAKPRQIEALIGSDHELLKGLLKESLQEVLEAEMTEAVGAGPGERTADRTGYRSGYYSRSLVTRIGSWSCGCPVTGRAGSRPSSSTDTAVGEGARERAGRDVRPGRVDAQGQGDHRGAVRARNRL